MSGREGQPSSRTGPAGLGDRDLARAVLERGFTPRRSDAPALFGLLQDTDERLARGAERALAQLGPEATALVRARLPAAPPPLRARLARCLGRLARRDSSVAAALVELLEDADPKTRRIAAIALGKLREPPSSVATGGASRPAEQALLARLRREPRVDVQRALAAALGGVGGTAASHALRGLLARGGSADAELGRVTAEALVKIERTLSRSEAPRLLQDAMLGPLRVRWWCRPGLEPLLADEIGRDARTPARGVVEATRRGRLVDFARIRTALRFAIVLPGVPVGDRDAGAALAELLAAEPAATLLATLTAGTPRFRIRWAGAGHRRARSFAAARRLRELGAPLVNDPTRSTWEAIALERDGQLEVALVPKALEDRRFDWRRAALPAASHPSVAAALARLAGVRADDVGWDPFCGSALELVERALLGPFRRLVGSDADPRAVRAARANVTAAGVRVDIAHADALRFEPPAPLTLVLSNPPLGRRVPIRGGATELLAALLARVAARLAPGGRVVWISPRGDQTARLAEANGLRATLRRPVDLGGVNGELQRFERRG